MGRRMMSAWRVTSPGPLSTNPLSGTFGGQTWSNVDLDVWARQFLAAYDAFLASGSRERRFDPRSGGDLYIISRDGEQTLSALMAALKAGATPVDRPEDLEVHPLDGSVFIDGDEALEQRYGVRVPVLRDPRTGRELDWPFDAAVLQAWLAASRS